MQPAASPESSAETFALFQRLNRQRRAIREFAPEPVTDADLEAVLAEACLAPSSVGLQPYELHVVKSGEAKARLATACNGQRAAKSAACLVVIVAGPGISRRRIAEAEEHYQRDAGLPQRSRDYHLHELARVRWAHSRWLLPLLALLRGLFTLLSPARSLLPLGGQGLRQWGARSAMLAAQTLMLAATARGLDSCPMEGFSGPAVARVLDLPWDSAPVVVVALGQRAATARIEPQWRRALAQMIRTH